ncbi:Cro/C1-type HTH DNA-binding domain protein [Bacteriovorax sp. BAL6_X]|uniref:helix-turn-helix domain-containing protein n=1 Tax=Bacteriovorax sp. BAL6_X TaxID=1201290 RepID=UPI000385C1EC|nr:helix-turn-helix transcriptional regulator [Bacteriovorax sp. BAL6_X]EPZ52431.1 Cro/C1-type HTH DNA-binding domain protein [Bacteriovorax sp. BAL6_X]
MSEFNKEKLDDYLGIIRKYMQVRGPMTQKELAESTGLGVSTVSRFLSMKTTEINPQVVAKITAELDIPLHEMIDFVEEHFSDHFIRLVKFYKGDEKKEQSAQNAKAPQQQVNNTSGGFEDALVDTIKSGTTGNAQVNSNPTMKIGGKTRTMPFVTDTSNEDVLKERMAQLTPRQKAYVADFLSLDIDARDLIVDLGNDLFRYFRQRGMIA